MRDVTQECNSKAQLLQFPPGHLEALGHQSKSVSDSYTGYLDMFMLYLAKNKHRVNQDELTLTCLHWERFIFSANGV